MDENFNISIWLLAKKTIRFFLPLIILLVLLTYFIFQIEVKSRRVIIEDEAKFQVNHIKNNLINNFHTIISSLMYFSEQHELQRMLEGDITEKKDLARNFLNFSKRTGKYDQIRYFDKTGMEIIRINYNNGDPVIVSDQLLQNKRERYYFKDTYNLNIGEVYVSPLDLNIEKGQIEIPQKPMIRFGTSVFDKNGNKRGILILNYLAKNMLSDLAKTSNQIFGDIMLLNSNGYWLKCPKNEMEWGFMYREKVKMAMSNCYPMAWQKIISGKSGKFYTPSGLFTFTTIYPLSEAQKSSTGSEKAFGQSDSMLIMEEYYWKLVIHIPNVLLKKTFYQPLQYLLPINFAFFIIFLLGSIIFARINILKQNTEQQLKKLSQAVEQSQVSVIITDLNGIIEYVNPQFTEITGYSFEDSIGKNPRILKSGKQSDEFYQELWNTLNAGKFWKGVFVNKKKNGDLYWESTSISPIRDTQGKITNFVAVREDITEHRKINIDLKKRVTELADARRIMLNLMEDINVARNEAEHATEAKSNFLANMSHEIRTPMNAIIGLTHLSLNTNLTKKQFDYLNKIQISAQSLLGIINDILDFSKIEAGKLEIESIDFDLNQVLDNLANMLNIKVEEKGLELIFAVSTEVPTYLTGDPLRLGQVLLNLANNAIKFTEKGEVVISTQLVKTKNKEVILRFEIKDTGIGMTKKQISRLFKTFSQADASTTRKYGGTGLGLTISKNLIELMGGKISVTSTPEKGSQFFFTIKFSFKKKDRRKFRLPSLNLKGLRVLVVDDSSVVRETMYNYLKDFSFTVSTVKSGKEAIFELEKASAKEKKPYDLVLMDWKMPGIDGIDTSLQIKKSTQITKIPLIIMMTAFGKEEIVQRAKKVKIDGFLIKPVSQTTLFDSIMQIYRKKMKTGAKEERSRFWSVNKKKTFIGTEILLVEDNELNQQVAKELLEGLGFIVTIANNGKEAISHFIDSKTEQKFALVLMDLHMPVMDGYQATKIIREYFDYKTLPIIAMTADAMQSVKKKTSSFRMNDYVSKPFDLEMLLSVLEQWIKPGKSKLIKTTNEQIKIETQIKTTIPVIKGISVETGLARVGNNYELYISLLAKFRKNNDQFIKEFKELLKEENYKDAYLKVHTIKGVSGNISAEQVYEKAKNLEEILKGNQKNISAINELTIVLALSLEQVFTSIDKFLDSIKSDPLKTEVSKGEQNNRENDINILIVKLKESLENYSSEALDYCRRLKNSFGKTIENQELDQLMAFIEIYDYENALSCLSRISLLQDVNPIQNREKQE